MAHASSVPPTSSTGGETTPQKQRSSTEKVVVWVGILILLALVALQARARLGYSKTLEALQDRMAEDEGVNANPLMVKDLNDYVFGWPSRKEESKGKHLSTIEMTWAGLPLTKPLGLVVGYDPDESGGTVMALETSGFAQSDSQAEDGVPPGASGGDPITDEPNPESKSAAEPATASPETPAAESPTTTEPTTEKPADQ